VDFGLYGGAAADNLDAIVPLADEGAVGFKTFRTEPPAGREREFVGLCAPSAADYRATVRRIAETGLVGAVHAEDATALRRREAELRASGSNGAASHLAWRPPDVELSSVRECLALAAEAGARIQIAHASLSATVDLVTRARNDGATATVETCPHYLFLDASALETFGPFAKTNPPFRGVDEVALLWDRLRAGEVDVVGSDHSPFLLEEKAPFREDFWPALPGVPGLEAMLPLMLTAAVDGRIDLERVVSLTSANAAAIFGLEAKGRLEPGADADVVIVKLGESTRLETKRWLTRSRATAAVWDGREARARVVRTILRGATVWDEDAGLVGAIGFGRNVRPRR
ncbi:MAG: dihydroorotase, partial [Chloroflexota bacterium]